MGQVLSLEDFAALDAKSEPPISQKAVLSLSDFEQIGSTEDAVKFDTPNPRFDLEQSLFKTMTKGTSEFFKNIGESFKIGDESSNIDMMGYSALIGEFDYDTDVKPIRERFNKKLKEDPIDGGYFLSDAIYAVSGMIPAMGKGLIEGKEFGLGGALGVSAFLPS